ncbi:TPA: hypothetical protein UL242_002493 [Clostridioides difficile]|uniref:hypothetical protein n=1 Tax=Clostridioides difficile TaxID=1496 RepID=UPI001A245F1D|nr:hypothetical protein [Clostridioides difficile]EGT3642430.1 hypothetical protein [Clostridioides difficile]MBH7167643.1 hypothetical protein [Clostridioides difficile]MBY1346153.1 hypothetical protein [Clostridioides difficile]MCW0912291.1 hypothetical protein [Clostridioides difficile]MDI2978691.1 hypothetical protein [Clostridioides difficile]
MSILIDLIITICKIQAVAGGLLFLIAFVLKKIKYKNKSLNFIEQRDYPINFLFSVAGFIVLLIPIFGFIVFMFGVMEIFSIISGDFEKEHSRYLLDVIRVMFNKEYDIKSQYNKEFRLTENILSDSESPHHEIVVKYAIAFESLAHEYNNIKEYIEDEKAIRDMRDEMKLALINLLKTVYSIVNDPKREVALKEKDILLENMKKYNNILSK